jgi:hypothetical protein
MELLQERARDTDGSEAYFENYEPCEEDETDWDGDSTKEGGESEESGVLLVLYEKN